MAVAEICETLPDRLSGSAVRAMLKRLEDKGFVRRHDSERGYLFSPTQSDSQASKTALSSVVKTFFNGSAAGAATALLGMSGRLDDSELNELEAMIARARQAKGA
jgi:predicted transcriptional regulator